MERPDAFATGGHITPRITQLRLPDTCHRTSAAVGLLFAEALAARAPLSLPAGVGVAVAGSLPGGFLGAVGQHRRVPTVPAEPCQRASGAPSPGPVWFSLT